jgi:cellobiose-specific phosphotransferase system component IIA
MRDSRKKEKEQHEKKMENAYEELNRKHIYNRKTLEKSKKSLWKK